MLWKLIDAPRSIPVYDGYRINQNILRTKEKQVTSSSPSPLSLSQYYNIHLPPLNSCNVWSNSDLEFSITIECFATHALLALLVLLLLLGWQRSIDTNRWKWGLDWLELVEESLPFGLFGFLGFLGGDGIALAVWCA